MTPFAPKYRRGAHRRHLGLFLVLMGAFLCIGTISCKKRISVDLSALKAGTGGVYYGGVYRVNENGDLRSMDPAGVNDVSSSHITSQIYDQLMDFDDSLNLTYELAERREIFEIISCIRSWALALSTTMRSTSSVRKSRTVRSMRSGS